MQYDVGIVGAGFAGLACARAAARRGLRVLVIDRKPAASRLERLPQLAKELVQSKPDLIIATGPQPARAAKGTVKLMPNGQSWRGRSRQVSPSYYTRATPVASRQVAKACSRAAR